MQSGRRLAGQKSGPQRETRSGGEGEADHHQGCAPGTLRRTEEAGGFQVDREIEAAVNADLLVRADKKRSTTEIGDALLAQL